MNIKKSLLLIGFTLLSSTTIFCMNHETVRLALLVDHWKCKKNEVENHRKKVIETGESITIENNEDFSTKFETNYVTLSSIKYGRDEISYEGLYSFIGDDSST